MSLYSCESPWLQYNFELLENGLFYFISLLFQYCIDVCPAAWSTILSHVKLYFPKIHPITVHLPFACWDRNYQLLRSCYLLQKWHVGSGVACWILVHFVGKCAQLVHIGFLFLSFFVTSCHAHTTNITLVRQTLQKLTC